MTSEELQWGWEGDTAGANSLGKAKAHLEKEGMSLDAAVRLCALSLLVCVAETEPLERLIHGDYWLPKLNGSLKPAIRMTCERGDHRGQCREKAALATG